MQLRYEQSKEEGVTPEDMEDVISILDKVYENLPTIISNYKGK